MLDSLSMGIENVAMKIPTKRFDTSLPLPSYEHNAAGFDLSARETTIIPSKQMAVIPSNLALAIPKGYVLFLVPRSSTPHKHGLMMPNSIGVIDPFYNGDDNEIMILVYNFTDKEVTIKKGDVFVQGILVKYETVEFDEGTKLPKGKRNKWHVPKK